MGLFTSLAIRLYASVSDDDTPGNDERRRRVVGFSANRGDPGLLRDRDRCRGRSGLVMPSIA